MVGSTLLSSIYFVSTHSLCGCSDAGGVGVSNRCQGTKFAEFVVVSSVKRQALRAAPVCCCLPPRMSSRLLCSKGPGPWSFASPLHGSNHRIP